MLDLANKADLTWLATLVADVRVAAPSIDLLLVGAMARDLLLWYANGIHLARATNDTEPSLGLPISFR